MAGALDPVPVLTTIEGLLESRLELLDRGERQVMERGSVEGQVFHRGSLRHLEPVPDPGLDDTLRGLVERGFLRPAEAIFAGETAFAFRHILIREAAYRGVPKKIRAEWHERLYRSLIEQEAVACVS